MRKGPSTRGWGERDQKTVYGLTPSAILLHRKLNGIKNKHGIFISFTVLRFVRWFVP